MSVNKAKKEPTVISAEEFAKGWDEERRTHELNPLTFHLRGSTMYVPARTKTDMDEAHGGPTPAVRTRTFDDYRVWINPCKSDTPLARKLRPATDTQSAAEFGFAIPLAKMGVKLSKTRQYTFVATRFTVENGGVVYEISFKELTKNHPEGKATTTSKPRRSRRKADKPAAPTEEAPE